eukprot:510334_1
MPKPKLVLSGDRPWSDRHIIFYGYQQWGPANRINRLWFKQFVQCGHPSKRRGRNGYLGSLKYNREFIYKILGIEKRINLNIMTSSDNDLIGLNKRMEKCVDLAIDLCVQLFCERLERGYCRAVIYMNVKKVMGIDCINYRRVHAWDLYDMSRLFNRKLIWIHDNDYHNWPQRTYEEEEEEFVLEDTTAEELNCFNMVELRSLCKTHNLYSSGIKGDMIKRLLDPNNTEHQKKSRKK